MKKDILKRARGEKMTSCNCNLNIHYTAPDEVWDKIAKLYQEMPEWQGIKNGIPYWFSKSESGKYLCASVEPGGLQFRGELEPEEWQQWLTLFRKKASDYLGYEIGEPEDGYDFVYY
ncbi:hypothetical protein M2139_002304 [Enterococcus sp. PF1-24]|uniref:hypothetical protein n=1 Tax=unclassified Enterococcus TaxID=2608891 RepID=UPI002474AB89|nr:MULTISPECIES: hypothetical protein [unclassified Enterococcus]MDH6365267.1 hypothetical protein [Enterococcus sp. PFB1-1]MDH6402403.1 hypothetical protein [Enterococcus sp. PF1-24]